MVRVDFLPESGFFGLFSLITNIFPKDIPLSRKYYKNSTHWKKVHPDNFDCIFELYADWISLLLLVYP